MPSVAAARPGLYLLRDRRIEAVLPRSRCPDRNLVFLCAGEALRGSGTAKLYPPRGPRGRAASACRHCLDHCVAPWLDLGRMGRIGRPRGRMSRSLLFLLAAVLVRLAIGIASFANVRGGLLLGFGMPVIFAGLGYSLIAIFQQPPIDHSCPPGSIACSYHPLIGEIGPWISLGLLAGIWLAYATAADLAGSPRRGLNWVECATVLPVMTTVILWALLLSRPTRRRLCRPSGPIRPRRVPHRTPEAPPRRKNCQKRSAGDAYQDRHRREGRPLPSPDGPCGYDTDSGAFARRATILCARAVTSRSGRVPGSQTRSAPNPVKAKPSRARRY